MNLPDGLKLLKPPAWALLIAVILLVASIRVRLLDVPLERDEGEYAHAGQLILEGVAPYRLAWNMKLPGTYAAYAVILALFGESTEAIHLGLLLVNAGAIVFVYLLGKRLLGAPSGLVASASYALLSLGASVLGTQAHATHFVVLPALAASLLLLDAGETGRPSAVFWSGLLYGLAFIMKQHAIFFGVFGALWLLWQRKSWRSILLFTGAAAIPFGFTCLVLWRAGVFAKFWFWTYTYARTYATEVSAPLGARIFAHNAPPVIQPNLLLWLLAGIGLFLAYWQVEARRTAVFLTGFLIFSFLAICPGFYFREHYFVLVLPAVALLIGATASPQLSRKNLPLWIFALAFVYSLFQQREFLFRMDPLQASRAMYGNGPFPQAIEVARYIRERSAPDTRIAVIGSEPEIYFYARRRAATGYIYTYSMMELHPYALQMQQEFIRNLEQAAPQYLVFIDVQSSWMRLPNSVSLIFEWWRDYAPKHYRPVGVADIRWSGETEYRWDDDAQNYTPHGAGSLIVFKRTEPQILAADPDIRDLQRSLSSAGSR